MPPVDVLRLAVPGGADPADAFAALGRDGAAAVWQDGWGGDGGFIGFALDRDDVLVIDGDEEAPVERLAEALRSRLRSTAAHSALLGWWGSVAYELGDLLHGLPVPTGAGPLATFAFIDRGIEFDAATRSVTLHVLADRADADAWLADTAARLLRATSAGPVEPERLRAAWRHDRTAYLARIAECRAAIHRGDAYQLCLTDRITVESDAALDPIAIARRLRTIATSTHGGVLRVGDRWLVSASPEQLLGIDASGTATTRPMKGTRPRGRTAEDDARLAAELLASDKERAENLMIVDLMRNDLSRVAAVGSVAVTDLFGVETFAYAHQLVSTIEAALERDAVDALLALFPAGSMTGAPKRSAMRLLADLEDGPRGMYSGVWGRLSLDGTVDLAVVIRSLSVVGGTATIGTGGGITALSVPEEEWDEIVLKAGPMLRAIGAG